DSATARSFSVLAPMIQQVFFIGDGLTGTGAGSRQEFVISAGADTLYLGVFDYGNYNNPGGFGSFEGTFPADMTSAGTARVPEPPPLLMISLALASVGAFRFAGAFLCCIGSWSGSPHLGR